MRIKTFLSFLISVALFSSCGRSINKFAPHPDNDFQWFSFAQNIYIPQALNADNCQDASADRSTAQAQIIVDGQWQTFDFFQTLRWSPDLGHPSMAQIVSGGQTDIDQLEHIQGQKQIKFCSEFFAQNLLNPLNTLQGATLSALVGVQRALDLWKKWRRSPWQSSIKIWMFPKLQERKVLTKKTGEKKFLVNNALYFHQIEVLAFMPTELVEGQNTLTTPALWVYPAVGAHEIGHHILDAYLLNHFDNQRPLANCFDTHHGFGLSGNSTENDMALMALHEAFADLWAFYAFDLPRNLYAGLSCFQHSRNPQDPRLDDGSLKKLTTQNIQHYLKQSNGQSSDYVCALEDKDPHYLGLLWANAVYKAFAKYQVTYDEAPDLLLQWAESFAGLQMNDQTGLTVMKAAENILQQQIGQYKQLEIPLPQWKTFFPDLK